MYARSTLVTFLLAALLAGWYFAFEWPRAGDTARGPEVKLTDLPVDRLTRIVIRRREGGTITLTREAGARDWRLDGGLADRQKIKRIYEALHYEMLHGSVEGKPDALGLEPAWLTVTLAAEGKQQTLRFGEAGPGGRRRYAQREGDPTIRLIRSRGVAPFDQPASALRDARLVVAEGVESVAAVTVQQGQTRFRLSRDGKNWRISPTGDRATAQAALLRLISARASAFLQGRQPPKGVARIRVELTGDRAETLEVGPLEQGGDSRLVWRAGSRLVMRVPSVHFSELLVPAEKLRDRRLLPGPADRAWLRRLAFTRGGATVRVVRESRRKTWRLDAGKLPALEPDRVKSLARLLEAARITAFEKGELTRSLSTLITEETWGRGRGERAEHCRLTIGRTADGRFAVSVGERPGLMRIEQKLAERLAEGRLAFRETTLLPVPQEQVAELTVTADGKSTRYRPRWRPALVGLLWQLENLVVERFHTPGSEAKALGLSPPHRRFELTDTSGKKHVLLLGKPDGAGRATAGLAGGPFGVIAPDAVKRLVAPLK